MKIKEMIFEELRKQLIDLLVKGYNLTAVSVSEIVDQPNEYGEYPVFIDCSAYYEDYGDAHVVGWVDIDPSLPPTYWSVPCRAADRKEVI